MFSEYRAFVPHVVVLDLSPYKTNSNILYVQGINDNSSPVARISFPGKRLCQYIQGDLKKVGLVF